MTFADRDRALKAYRVSRKTGGGKELAARLKVENAEAAHRLANIGFRISGAEDYRLTDREWEAMKVIVRVEARRILQGHGSATTRDVDWAAGKYAGWCANVVARRLRKLRDSEQDHDDLLRKRFDLVEHSPNGHIWLTPSGWMLAWLAGFIKPNWKVPA
jgi:Mn-dependent DtxR family transcriptional regulator